MPLALHSTFFAERSDMVLWLHSCTFAYVTTLHGLEWWMTAHQECHKGMCVKERFMEHGAPAAGKGWAGVVEACLPVMWDRGL